jgi:diguanylate cyclase (GGDEF)-like protein/PAS domain S-box-containing protein
MMGGPAVASSRPRGGPLNQATEVLDALAANIAVVSEEGDILAVNEAWRRFAGTNGCIDERCFIGWNYLSVCDAAGAVSSEAAEIARGLRGVIRGDVEQFQIEYACPSPAGPRWFVMSVRPVSRGGTDKRAVIAHHDVTARKLSELAAQKTERLLRQVLENLPVGVWILDAEGTIIHGNPAGQEIWRGARYLPPEQFGEYVGWWVSTGERIAADDWAAARAIRNGETSIGEEIEIQCFDGSRKFILNSAMPLRDADGRVTGAIIVNQDVTTRMRNEETLRRTTSRLQTLFSIVPVGVSIVNRDARIVEMNAALERILDLNPEKAAARQFQSRRYIARDGSPLAADLFPSGRALREKRQVSDVEIGVFLENGELVWTNVSAAPLPNSDGDVVVVTADVTARIRAEEALVTARNALEEANRELQDALAREHLLARTDALTGVRNRRHFYDIAAHEFTVARRYEQDLSVIMFDIDLFKSVNDTYGHKAGDEVLQRVAAIIALEVRDADLLARYGGEEFIVVLPNSAIDVAMMVAERVREQVARFDWPGEHGLAGLTISAGVAAIDGTPTLDLLIRNADRALYEAKSRGRDNVVSFDPEATVAP